MTTQTVVAAWAEQVRSTPTRTALSADGQRFSFAELDARSARWARWLVARDAGPGRVVANLLPRSVEAIIAQLAVLRSGASHLAVDPAGPVERTAQILGQADPVVTMDSTTVGRIGDEPDWTRADVDPESVAYLVFTSGSTGTPKGVLVEHRSLSNLLAVHRDTLFATAADAVGDRPLRVAHALATPFDASWDPFLWMVGGHELYLLSDEQRTDPRLLDAAIRDNRLDVVEVTPGQVERLVAGGLLDSPHAPALLLTGGEGMGQALWDRLGKAPRTTAVNLYGPSECTVFMTSAMVRDHEQPVIGYPIANATVLIVDGDGAAVPVGSPGELVVGGSCVARGYVAGDESNRWRLPSAVGPRQLDRWFHTGDLVRYTSDGALEFLGRSDRQVKIRGHRIELGEVEAALRAHQDVNQAVADVRDINGQRSLVGYVVSSSDTLSAEVLRAFLGAVLPASMMPAVLVFLPGLPLNVNGKVDIAALPDPRSVGAPDGDRPRTATEILLAEVFRLALGGVEMSRNADFFELGGHSLLAAVVAETVTDRGLTCTLQDIMENPCLLDLAAHLNSMRAATIQEGSTT